MQVPKKKVKQRKWEVKSPNRSLNETVSLFHCHGITTATASPLPLPPDLSVYPANRPYVPPSDKGRQKKSCKFPITCHGNLQLKNHKKGTLLSGFLLRDHCTAHTEFTTAILLIIKVVLFDNRNPPLTQSTLPPVLSPPAYLRIRLNRILTGRINLLQTLPARRCQRRGDYSKPMLMCITGRIAQAHFKAAQAAASPFGLVLHSLHLTQPGIVCIIGIHNVQSQRLCITRTLLLTDEILLQRVNIGIAIINGRAHSMLHQTFDNGRRTRCTTRMEQDLLGSSRYLQLKFLLFHRNQFIDSPSFSPTAIGFRRETKEARTPERPLHAYGFLPGRTRPQESG